MLAGMSSAELTYWQDEASRELLGSDREDYRAARLEAAIGNFAGKSLKEGVTLNPVDCMPYRDRSQERAPRRWTRRRAAEQAHAVFGAFVKRKPNNG